MTPKEIRAAVRESEELTALAVARDMPAIAAALSAGRTKHASYVVSARGLSSHLGPLPLEAILMKLEAVRDTLLAAAESQQLLLGAVLRRYLRFLDGDGLDFGDPALLAMLDMLGGQGMLEPGEVSALKGVALMPDPVDELEVRRALIADNGDLRI